MVSGACLSKDGVVGSTSRLERSRTDAFHVSRLQVHAYRKGHEAFTSCLVAIHVDAFQQEVRITNVCSCWVPAVIVGNQLPELRPNKIATLFRLSTLRSRLN